MSNLRELVAAAMLSGNLEHDPLTEAAVDRIGALAFTDELGGALWRLKYANHHRDKPGEALYSHAVQLLVRRIGKRRGPRLMESRDLLTKLAIVAIEEWMHDACGTCGGRRWIVAKASSAKHMCTVCNGTGVRRHSDQHRCARLGLSRHAYAKLERRFADAHQKISDADVQAWRDVYAQLRSWVQHPAIEKLLAFAKRRFTLRAVACDGPAQKSNDMPEYTVSSATG